MKRSFFLVIILMLLISCMDKNERVMKKLEKSMSGELSYKIKLSEKQCLNSSKLSKNSVDNTEKCINIFKETKTKYDEKFLLLMDYYKDKKMNRNELESLYSQNREEMYQELEDKILLIGSEISIEDGNETVKHYKVLGIIALWSVDKIEGPGTYDSEINTIMTNNDLEWQKNNTMEMHIKMKQYIYSLKIPEFQSDEIRTLVEDYTNLAAALEVAISYDSLGKIQSLNEEIKSITDKITAAAANMSPEDAEIFSSYFADLTENIENGIENKN